MSHVRQSNIPSDRRLRRHDPARLFRSSQAEGVDRNHELWAVSTTSFISLNVFLIIFIYILITYNLQLIINFFLIITIELSVYKINILLHLFNNESTKLLKIIIRLFFPLLREELREFNRKNISP